MKDKQNMNNYFVLFFIFHVLNFLFKLKIKIFFKKLILNIKTLIYYYREQNRCDFAIIKIILIFI